MTDYYIYNIFTMLILASFGLSIGSFITLVSRRLVDDEDIIYKSSHCPICDHKLSIKDLIPCLSWILSSKKCRYCKNKISIRYPIIEIITSVITILIFDKYKITIHGLLILLITICLITLIITDLENYIIPDQIQISLTIIAIIYQYYFNNLNIDILFSAFIACSIGIILRKIVFIVKKQDPLGFGDIKFLAIVGLYLPINIFPIYFFLSGAIGVITAIIWKLHSKDIIFPFAPALAISLFICITYPQIENIFNNIIFKIGQKFL
jgi:prepilin signal peptidase PulO-like enzyme (type II secretory pathway)